MAQTITILHTPGCPNATLLRERLAHALSRSSEPAPQVTVEEITDPDGAVQRRFHGSPALLVDGVDAFVAPGSPVGFACRTYRTDAGIEGAPSVNQIVAVLANGEGSGV